MLSGRKRYSRQECLQEVLKTEASNETKRSQCFETDILCVLVGTKNEERQFANVVIKDEGTKQNLSPKSDRFHV